MSVNLRGQKVRPLHFQRDVTLSEHTWLIKLCAALVDVFALCTFTVYLGDWPRTDVDKARMHTSSMKEEFPKKKRKKTGGMESSQCI